jgi:hypothetical protein
MGFMQGIVLCVHRHTPAVVTTCVYMMKLVDYILIVSWNSLAKRCEITDREHRGKDYSGRKEDVSDSKSLGRAGTERLLTS